MMAGTTQNNIIRDAWLSDIFGYDVYRLILDEPFIQECGRVNLESLQKGHVFLYCKVATDYLEGARFLENNGFYLVDTNVVFKKEIVPGKSVVPSDRVRFVRKEDEEGVARIAGSSFMFSRFHLDRNIPDDVAHRIKAEWARNYFRGTRGDSMVVAENKKDLAGFLQLVYGPDRRLVIDLVAVGREHRKQGLARSMISYAEDNCGDFSEIIVGTQLANATSVRFYEDTGFRYISSQYIFHYTN